MATATMASPGKRAALVDDLIRTAKAIGLHGGGANRRPWLSAARIASAMGLEPGKLAAPMATAESAGLLSIRRTEAGRVAVRLSKLAAPRIAPRLARTGLNDIGDCPHHEIVLAVASMPSTSPLIEDLAVVMGRSRSGIGVELSAAVSDDWLDDWPDAPTGPSVVLTPLAAERLGLVISSDYSKWLRVGQTDFTDDDPPRDLTEADVTSDNGSSPFDALADPDDPPDVRVIQAETAETRCRELAETPDLDTVVSTHSVKPSKPRRTWGEDRLRSLLEGESLDGDNESRIPRPRMLIGTGRSWPWMVPDSNPPRPWTRRDGSPCPACHGKPLNPAAACLVCDAMGVDALLDRIKVDRILPGPAPQCGHVRTALRGGV